MRRVSALCFNMDFLLLFRRVHCLTVELLAKNRENGSTPSLAISCLTLRRAGRSALVAKVQLVGARWVIPLEAVKVITTMFPKIEKAIMPDITRGARSLPKTSLKNTVAMSRLSYSRSLTETAHSYRDVSPRMMFFFPCFRREEVRMLC